MLVYRTFTKTKGYQTRDYRILLLFGFIPLFIWVDG